MTATLPRAARSLSLFARLVSWYECSRSRVHLSRLDDKMLDDLGLSRADVHHECSKPFWA